MVLDELPEKTSRRLLKSVTWTEVEGTSPYAHALRRFIRRVAHTHPSRWIFRTVRGLLDH